MWKRGERTGASAGLLQAAATDLAYAGWWKLLRNPLTEEQPWVEVDVVLTPGGENRGNPAAYWAGLEYDYKNQRYVRDAEDRYVPKPCSQGAAPRMSYYQGFMNEQRVPDLKTLPPKSTAMELLELVCADRAEAGLSTDNVVVLCDKRCFFNGALHVVVTTDEAAWFEHVALQKKKRGPVSSSGKGRETSTQVNLMDCVKVKPQRKAPKAAAEDGWTTVKKA